MKSFRSFLQESYWSRPVQTPTRLHVGSYISADYGGPNRDLRATEGKHKDSWTDGLDATMRPIKAANKTLYRGISKYDASGLKPGDVIKDHGYMSTTVNKGVAHTFAMRPYEPDDGGKQHSTVMTINAPAGTKAISVRQALRGYPLHNIGENEHILARGTSLRVDAIHHVESETNHVHFIHATVVGQD